MEIDVKQGEYLSLLEKINLKIFEGYDAKKILFNETNYCMYINWGKLIKLLIKSFLFKNYYLKYNIKNQNILLLYSKNYRLDHDDYWKKIKKDIKKYDEINILTDKKILLTKFPRKLYYFLKSFKDLRNIKSYKDRCYLSIRLVDRRMVFDDVDKLNVNPKLVMCFSDNSPDENVLMQYFKFKGAITVTNQHGFCAFQSYKYDRLNQSQILNFKCDYFLAKSLKQKEQFILAGYNSNKIKIVGAINFLNQSINVNPIVKCIGIYLDCPTIPFSADSNEKLINLGIQLANELKIKYIIKCHPQDSIDNYKNAIDSNCFGIYGKETSLKETLKEVDICIIHASATYIDAYMQGCRCLKMNSKINYPIAVKEDEINSKDDAIKLIKEWNIKSVNEKKDYINSIRKQYVSEWKKGNIQKTLEEILKENEKLL